MQRRHQDVDSLLRRPRSVGVLDAKDERPTVVAGEQPIEQRRARVAHVQLARGRGGDAAPDVGARCGRPRTIGDDLGHGVLGHDVTTPF